MAPARETKRIWLILFLVPFIAAGLFVIVLGIRTVPEKPLPGFALAAFGLFFLSIPCGVLALMHYGGREERRRAERRAANPDRPWTWREDFASGVIHPEGEIGSVFALAFSLFWNAAAAAGAWAGIREYLETGDWRFLIVLVFPAAGAALLCWAVTHTRRWLRYRKSVLRLDATPAEIGGRLEGTILVPTRLEPAGGFDLTLDCLRRTRDRDNDTHDTILWQERTRVAGPVPSHPHAETAIRVSIPIPPNCEPWNDETPDHQVIWQLRVIAKVAGAPDLNQLFEVPVFRTRPQDPAERREPLPDGFIRPSARAVRPAASRVRMEGTAEGAEFVFPPAGGWKSVPAFLVSFAVTAGIAWGIAKAGAPLIFPVVVAAFGLIPTLLFLWSAAGEVRLVTGSQGVKLTYRLLGFRKAWRAEAGEVLEAGISVMLQSGHTPHYGFLLRRRNGKPLFVFAMIADKGEADWLASEIDRRLPR
jgi:hypothetical protein